MRYPQAPPAFEQFSNADLPELLARVQSAGVLGPEQGGRYLHWDELRHREPPDGLTSREWWFAVALARRSLRRPVPLRAADGSPCGYCPVDRVQELLSKVDQQAAGRQAVRGEVANPLSRDRYLRSSIVEEAVASSLLEGAATTRRAARQMLRSGRRARTHGERMVVNNHEAMHLLRERRDEPLTIGLILELHRTITASTIAEEDAGRFRSNDDIAVLDERGEVLHVPSSWKELQARAETLCRFANEGDPDRWHHPVVRAVLLHYWLAYDHPFVDGNGRTARALFYWSMLNQGYWLCEFVSISRLLRRAPARYSRSYLHAQTDGHDLTYFLVQQLETLVKAIDELWAYVDRKESVARAVERRLRARADLNHRQLALLGHALRHPDHEYTIQSHRNSHGVSYATGRADLLQLAEHGLLDQSKRGKAFVFHPARDLETRLNA